MPLIPVTKHTSSTSSSKTNATIIVKFLVSSVGKTQGKSIPFQVVFQSLCSFPMEQYKEIQKTLLS